MMLVDTSVWIDHCRSTDTVLSTRLLSASVCVHPMVIGELSCGNLINRTRILSLLHNLPKVNTASDAEVMEFVEYNGLMEKDIGFIDAHLLAAGLITPGTLLWTRDKRLRTIANELGCADRTV